MLPPLGSLIVITIKDSSIAAVIAVPELMRQSQIIAQWTFHPFEVYTAVMIVYFLLCSRSRVASTACIAASRPSGPHEPRLVSRLDTPPAIPGWRH